MKIKTQHIPVHGMELAFRAEADTFAVLKQLSDEGQGRFTAPVYVELAVTPEHDLIKVSGSIATSVRLACSRCLESFELPLRHHFTLRYSRRIPTELHAGGTSEEMALTAEQIGLVFFEGDEIDFREAVQEQVVLALPYKPLCKAQCRGLCAHCGADLNGGACGCADAAVDNPFAVLQNRRWPQH